jgi:cytochrome c551/c552
VDLRKSKIVALDVDGTLIGQILRGGVSQTARVSPMPAYRDLSNKNIQDLAGWVHYSLQQNRFAELKVAAGGPGDPAEGKTNFDKTCASCHSAASMVDLAKKYPTAELRVRVLKPASLNTVQSFTLAALHDDAKKAAKQAHGKFLENANQTSVNNLMAYFGTLK